MFFKKLLSISIFLTLSYITMVSSAEQPTGNGIGFNFGARIFYPTEVNYLIGDIYDKFKSGYSVTSEFGGRFKEKDVRREFLDYIKLDTAF